jgi:hypothetical protein
MQRSFIVRVYCGSAKGAGHSKLRGVVENPRREQVAFRSIDELAKILESDNVTAKTNKGPRRWRER